MSPRRRKIVADDDVIEATRAARLPDSTNGATPPPPPLTPSLVEERDDMELDAVLKGWARRVASRCGISARAGARSPRKCRWTSSRSTP